MAASDAPYVNPDPGSYIAPTGVKSTLPGHNVEALRGPSEVNPTTAITHANAQMNAYEQPMHTQGMMTGVEINLPDKQ